MIARFLDDTTRISCAQVGHYYDDISRVRLVSTLFDAIIRYAALKVFESPTTCTLYSDCIL